MPNDKRRVNPIENTITETDDFKAFVEKMNIKPEPLLSLDQQIELKKKQQQEEEGKTEETQKVESEITEEGD